MKKLSIILLILAALLVGADQYAPQLAAAGLYHALSTKMELQPDDVHVQASPGLKVMAGDLDAVEVHGTRFRVGGLQFDQFDCQLTGVSFSPWDSLADQKITVLRAQSGDMSASIQKDALQQFLLDKVKGLSDAEVAFDDDTVIVQGTISAGGFLTARAVIRGHFGMNGAKLMFVPSDVSVEGLGLTYSSKHIGNIEVYDFSSFPLGIVPDRVVLRDNQITIHGRVSNS